MASGIGVALASGGAATVAAGSVAPESARAVAAFLAAEDFPRAKCFQPKKPTEMTISPTTTNAIATPRIKDRALLRRFQFELFRRGSAEARMWIAWSRPVQHVRRQGPAARPDRQPRQGGDRGGAQPHAGRLDVLRGGRPDDRRDQVRGDECRARAQRGGVPAVVPRQPRPVLTRRRLTGGHWGSGACRSEWLPR